MAAAVVVVAAVAVRPCGRMGRSLVAAAFGRTGGKRLVEESSARAIELQAQGDDERRTAGAGT
jgi:hypothetical protein